MFNVLSLILSAGG
ncbi:hypothetical protein YPPY91_2783, partial [Yersinia pestis PY-91]